MQRNIWLMRQHTAPVCVVLLCIGLLLCGTVGGETMTLDFKTVEVGRLPADFSPALTGRGDPGAWHILDDPTAPGGGKVLAQTSTNKTSYRFPLCVYDQLSATDVTVSVRFKAVTGTVDRAAGLVARFKDKDNYYIVRANALEHNVRLYKVERGDRKQFAGVDVKVPSGQWQRLTRDRRLLMLSRVVLGSTTPPDGACVGCGHFVGNNNMVMDNTIRNCGGRRWEP